MNQDSALPPNPAKDPNFKEDRIDKLRTQKDDELDRYRRTMERTAIRQGDFLDQSLKMSSSTH